MRTIRRIQRGFSLVSAIFLLVVIAALGVFAVTLSTTQQSSSALDVQGARAYQAARAGVEWGAFQVLRNNPGAFAAACRGGAGNQVFSPSGSALAGTLSGFNVMVQCAATVRVEDGSNLWVYQLTSTATQGTAGTPHYVERQILLTIAR